MKRAGRHEGRVGSALTLGQEVKDLHHLTTVAALFVSLLIVGCTKKKMKQGSSVMDPTIKAGDVITIDLTAYSKKTPSRWDVVLFEAPVFGPGQWTSRVVGMPGDVVDLTRAGLTINGKAAVLPPHIRIGPYQLPSHRLSPAPGPVKFPFTVPPGGYFLMGDNVANSLDSRYWGALDESRIIGKVIGK